MKEFAEAFYKSNQWEKCRQSYLKSVGGLCERCRAKGRINPAKIVHHKIFLNQANINDPLITLNWHNLEAVCKQCHEEIHENCGRKQSKRYIVDDSGRIYGIDFERKS
ncbi:MAG TPA: HNH endonuclease [bacterium]|nr:HNH endonuclease [bacterium]